MMIISKKAGGDNLQGDNADTAARGPWDRRVENLTVSLRLFIQRPQGSHFSTDIETP
jgi:hypothetical protein